MVSYGCLKIQAVVSLFMWFSKKKNIEALFLNAYNDKSAEDIELLMPQIARAESISDETSAILIKLLQEDWHYKHEDIAMLLKKIKDPKTVEALYTAAKQKFDYLEYDDTFQFARKCIKALAAIGDDNAIEKLRLLKQSDNNVIKAYAEKELNYKELQ